MEDQHDIMEKVITGGCLFSDLPPLNKKVVRIFVSSTFSDTKEERNALMREVYPKLAELCRDKFGLEFQVVDMRWGVPEHASDNHSTTELCLEEIKKCQEVSVGPNFVVLLGHKYGFRPIPNIINENEFTAIEEAANTAGEKNWALVQKWYVKDENTIPPVFVLQPISSLIKDYNNKDDSELRKKAQAEWWNTEYILIKCVRTYSAAAFEAGKLTEAEKHKFFMSVTENEIHNGILKSRSDPKENCIALIRDIPDIAQHLEHVQAPRFIDTVPKTPKVDEEANNFLKILRDERLKEIVPENNISHVTIEWDTSGANVSMENAEYLGVAKFAQKMLKEKEIKVLKHKEYLDGVCKEFYEKASKLIKQGGVKNSRTYDELVTEVLQHLHFAKVRCEVFEGREDILADVKTYLASDSTLPLVLYGNSGCGKTTVMARIFETLNVQVADDQSNAQKPLAATPVIRFLGTTPLTSNIQQVLVSVCKQISKIYGQQWDEPGKFSELVKSFSHVLQHPTKEKPLILLIDSVDQLMPAYDAYKMNWLPEKIPENVKIIVSTLDEGYKIFDILQKRYSEAGGKFIQVKPLGENIGLTIIQRWLRKSNRSMTPDQEGIVKRALTICSLPLYARITFDQIRRWRSFDKPTIEDLKPTIQGAIIKHFEAMETKFGAALVKHCLAYLTASRYGLSEMEIEHVLSLDDDLLGQIYKFWRPPVRRIPPLLWTRVRNEINYYVVERSADGILVLAWYHRQFITATKARYLSDATFSSYIHSVLAEYFLGKYGGGKRKPFEYTEHQRNRFKLDTTKSEEDRKVPSQPYYTESVTSGEVTMRFNQRKLSELPLHLLKSRQHDLLRKEVFFNYEWLYAKLKATSVRSLLQEFELFMMADKSLRKDPELKLLFSNLQLIRPYVSVYPDCLALELTGRLAKNIGLYNSITALIKQCDVLGPKHCPLTPVLTMYQSADIGLKQNLNFRDTDNWHEGGAFTCSKDFSTLYLVDYDIQGFSYLAIWDIPTGEKISQRTISKEREESVTDIYLDLFLDNSETLLIGSYKMKYYNRINAEKGDHRFTGYGHIEVITIEDCSILFTFKEFLHKQDFHNTLCYIRDNWLCFQFGWHLPVINYKGEKKHIQLNNPNMLTYDEKYFITICGKRVGVKSYQGEDKTVANVRTKSATIKEFETKENQAEFEKTEFMKAIAVGKDNRENLMVYLGDGEGNVNVYKVKRVSEGKFFKVKRTLSLARNHKLNVTANLEEMKGDENVHIDFRVKLILSPNEDFLIGVYQSCYDTKWEAVLWNITSGEDLGHIAKDKVTEAKYPKFNFDGSMIIIGEEKEVRLIQSSTGQVLKTYNIGQDIRDITVSTSTPQMALMLGKDIMFLDTTVVESSNGSQGGRRSNRKRKPGAQRKQEERSSSTSLLPLEIVTNTNINQEILLEKIPGKGDIQLIEREGILESIDLGGLSSARSASNVPLDTWETPNGKKVIQLRSKVQVIDTKEEEIKYTPRSGDIIVRTVQQEGQSQTNTVNLEIPNLSGSISANPMVELQDGDRIVGEANKTKLRVTNSSKGKMKIMTVPSIISIGVLHESFDKIKRLRRITVYQESISTVSNNYLVMHKKKATGEYINIYNIEDGKLVATHSVGGAIGCVRISVDEKRLFVATKDRSLKAYSGQMFLTNDTSLGASQAPSTQRFAIRDLITFPHNSGILVMRYSEEGAAGMAVNSYIHINLASKQKSPAVLVKPMLEDISRDGSIAIDNQLNLYDLPQGQIFKKLPYSKAGINMQLQVRISDDKKYVVLLDVNDDTLHVIKLTGRTAKPIASCFTHAPDLSTIDGFSLRQCGRLILIRGLITGLLAIRDPAESLKEGKIKYQNETQRAISLVDEQKLKLSTETKGVATQSIQKSDSPAIRSGLPTLATENKTVIQDFISSLN